MDNKMLSNEQQVTLRFQMIYGTAITAVALVVFWASTYVWTIDLRFCMFLTMIILALTWLKDGLIMLADVAIVVMKLKRSG